MRLYTPGILEVPDSSFKIKRGYKYSNLIVAFDIETTSAWITPDGNVIGFDENISKKYYSKCTPISICYLWQIAIEDEVYYGRKLEIFIDCLNELLNKTCGIITIWVHNLAYEFQFLLNILEPDKLFARSPHKVIYFDIYRIRFRCSYFLKHMSLKKWGESLLFNDEKKDDGYDYMILRTPNTHLNNDELHYGEQDVKVIVAGIREDLLTYNNIIDIPLTQTGKVREKVKAIFKRDTSYHKLCTDLLPVDSSEYALLKSIFAGGYTHANYMHANVTVNDVYSYDRSSSYPALMCTKKYPMTPWQEIDIEDINKYNYPDYSLILDITFYDIKSTTFNTYISTYKCYEIEEYCSDNGRVSNANKLSICITNLDYEIIKQCYKWDEDRTKINKVLMSVNEYLDKRFVQYLMELYKNKTTLKDVQGKEMLYMTSKESFNAMFGMMCTAIIQENVNFNMHEWTIEHLSTTAIDTKLLELSGKPYKNYLAYQWGVWITAYARQALWDSILAIDFDTVYTDTDSNKHIGKHDDIFDNINKKLYEEILNVCMDRNFTIDDFTATDPKGNTHIMGLWEYEGHYSEFKTLGAKRYVYRDDKNVLHMTVSGVSKTEGVKSLNDNIDNFTNQLVIPPKYSKRLAFTYCDNMPDVVWNKGKYDEYVSQYRYGINALPSPYSVNIDAYLDILEIAESMMENLITDAKSLHDIWRQKNEKAKILQNRQNKKDKC